MIKNLCKISLLLSVFLISASHAGDQFQTQGPQLICDADSSLCPPPANPNILPSRDQATTADTFNKPKAQSRPGAKLPRTGDKVDALFSDPGHF